MPSNIEIKAKVTDLDQLRRAAIQIATGPCQTLYQEDVFFRVPMGRLKLRIVTDGSGELIYYERPDTSGAKQSNYEIHATSGPAELRRLLSAALGETITVKKRREVYSLGQTRIHLDEVEALGTFMELEVVLRPDQDLEEGRDIVSHLMAKLGVSESDLVPCAYADLLLSGADQDDPAGADKRHR